MELEEAIEILKNQIGDYVIANYCKDCHNKVDCVDDCNYLLSIYTVLQELEELQKENEKLKEIDLTIVHIKGVCDEKEHWRNKIKEKIEEIKQDKDNKYWFEFLEQRDIENTIEILEELLKGE